MNELTIKVEDWTLGCEKKRDGDFELIECSFKPNNKEGSKITLSPWGGIKVKGNIEKIRGDFDDKMFWLDIRKKTSVNIGLIDE